MANRHSSPDFDQIATEFDDIKGEIDALLEPLREARVKYFRTRAEADKQAMLDLHGRLDTLRGKLDALGPKIRAASGLSEEEIAVIERSLEPKVQAEDRKLRSQLTSDKVAPTAWVQEHLASGIDSLSRILPKEWLVDDRDSFRLHGLIKGELPLSLVKGLRIESEIPTKHRLSQMMAVASDYLADHIAFDHFAAATLAPQLAQLGRQFSNLQQVGGNVAGRTANLWVLPSDQMDAALFELLVAAGCVEKGRRVEFLPETSEKSPDIRAHDPFPLVIECKHRQPFSDYELAEERQMRSLFLGLEAEAHRRGMRGRFDLHLKVEADAAPQDEVVQRLISQRLAPHPERPLEYAWGSVAYHELPRIVDMPAPTRIYSANMLQATFDWNTDLPEWDGLICRTANKSDPIVGQVTSPIGLAWTNVSERAIMKRTWAPINLFGSAVSQVPKGEYGIVYVAYAEGARENIADSRVETYLARMQEWEHSAAIRLPISFLVRLYPRSLGPGEPDLIESTMRFASAICNMTELFNDFPNGIYTSTAEIA